jgi:hypothetical protein
MAIAPGTRVVLESKSLSRPRRTGTIEEVVREEPFPRYRIRWDDGHETLHTPAAGVLHPVSEARAHAPA